MHLDWAGLLGLLGPISICAMFLVLGLLSRRLGRVTRTPPYYVGFFIAALLVAVSTAARMVNLGLGADMTARLHQDGTLVLIYSGLMALGVTIAAFVAWRYWSWLLSERS
jgi:hypothetical protein